MAGKKKKNNNSEMAQMLQLMQKLLVNNQQQTSKKKKKSKPRRKKNGGGVSDDGVIHLRRCELLKTITLSANSGDATGEVDLFPSSFSFLKGLYKSFDRLRWNSLEFYYKPAVGTTYGGLVSMGIDWDFVGTGVYSRQQISALTPTSTCAAWADTQNTPMRLPANRIQSRMWYTPQSGENVDKGPGSLAWAASGTTETKATTLGEIWVRYSVTMSGTNPNS